MRRVYGLAMAGLALCAQAYPAVGQITAAEGKAIVGDAPADPGPSASDLSGEIVSSSIQAEMHWIMNALLSFAFPVIALRSGAYPFVFFAGMMIVQFFVVLFFFPETKQISLEGLQRKLKIV